jgi:hypothetical protein
LFGLGERRQLRISFALASGVVAAIQPQFRAQFRAVVPVYPVRVLAFSRPARLAHLVHDLVIGLAVFELERLAQPLQLAGQCGGERHSQGAAPRFNWNNREAVTRDENVREYLPLEIGVMSDPYGCVCKFARDRIAGTLYLYGLIIERISKAEHLGCRVGSVTGSAYVFQGYHASRLNIDMPDDGVCRVRHDISRPDSAGHMTVTI